MNLGLFKTEQFHADGLRPMYSRSLMDLGLFFKLNMIFIKYSRSILKTL